MALGWDRGASGQAFGTMETELYALVLGPVMTCLLEEVRANYVWSGRMMDGWPS